MHVQQNITWSVAIFTARETIDELRVTIDAALASTAHESAVLDIIVNGNPALAQSVKEAFATLDRSSTGKSLRIWNVVAPDKAHAWNQYVHQIWSPSALTFFVDGYANVMPDAFTAIATAMHAAPNKLAATGVPTFGRSARTLRDQLISEGGLHGNLYALRDSTMAKIRETGFRLPLGLYRNDAMLGAAINFRFDPAHHAWDPKGVLAVPSATWRYRPGSWRSLNDLKGQWRRKLRQAQGQLENLAVREHLAVRKLSPASLPKTASALILGWVDEFPQRARALCLRYPLCFLAIRKARQPRDWSQATVPPELLTVQRPDDRSKAQALA